jgi:hypothetical protein
MTIEDCPIWNTPAQIHADGSFAGHLVSSMRAGYSPTGAVPTYKITGSAEHQLRHEILKPSGWSNIRRGLTNWIVARHLAGEIIPTITSDTVIEAANLGSLTFGQRRERFLRFLRDRKFEIGNTIDENEETLLPLLDFEEEEQIGSFLILLSRQGILRPMGHGEYELDLAGIDLLETTRGDTSKVFVAMWFNESVNAAYSNGIAQAVIRCGLEPVRIDRVEHSDKICDRIVAEIRGAKFVVADFTCGVIRDANGGDAAIPRGGVYYEAGLAQGLGKPVIWTCRADQIGHVHFDTRQYAHILWTDPSELMHALEARIRALGLNA